MNDHGGNNDMGKYNKNFRSQGKHGSTLAGSMRKKATQSRGRPRRMTPPFLLFYGQGQLRDYEKERGRGRV